MGLFLVGVIASCNKDYTCECEYDDGTGTTIIADYKNVSKRFAENSCEKMETTYPGVSCTLK